MFDVTCDNCDEDEFLATKDRSKVKLYCTSCGETKEIARD